MGPIELAAGVELRELQPHDADAVHGLVVCGLLASEWPKAH